jgi:hypothetical protein
LDAIGVLAGRSARCLTTLASDAAKTWHTPYNFLRIFMIMALLLDLANIVGGFLLAVALLRRLPRVGDDLGRGADKVAPFGWIVGIVALVAGGYYLLVHLVSGPHVFHFEVVGILVGVALLWDRLAPGRAKRTGTGPGPNATWPPNPSAPGATATVDSATGVALLLAIFGIIAIVVGIQGLFTPD